MELRRLRLLHELSRRGTIAAVADALSYSPSSVSVQLAELEREAGTELLRRVGRGVQLTPAGWRLADHAAQALAADEAVRAELSSLGEAPHGRVRVTFVQSAALALLPTALAHLNENAPDLRVEVFQRENDCVVVYLFPLTAEISKKDERVDFYGQIGRLVFAQVFSPLQMEFQGKLEL